jgi:hypothetical protein
MWGNYMNSLTLCTKRELINNVVTLGHVPNTQIG